MPQTELRTEVEIDASPERVWSVLTDVARYHEWNPFITSLEGELKPGSQLRVTMSLPEGGEHIVKPTVLRCEPNEELRWRGQILARWIFDAEHFFKLEAVAPGKTKFVQGENFGGLLLKYIAGTLNRTARGFVYMNVALKKRVEGTG